MAERDNEALLDYVQELTSQTAPTPAQRLSSLAEVNELKATNEQLTKSCREALEKAAQLQWQVEQESSPHKAEDNRRMAALESTNEALVSILSKTLGVDGVSKGYQHASVDAMIFAMQVCARIIICSFVVFVFPSVRIKVCCPHKLTFFLCFVLFLRTQRLVTKLQTELQVSLTHPNELREAKESLRSLTTELGVYKKKFERLETRVCYFYSMTCSDNFHI